MTPQNDYYIEAKESPYGGYNIKRYRDEGAKFIYTEKVWEKIKGQPARREEEHEVSMEEFASRVAEFPNAVKIKKDREWFAGNYKDKDISITIDSVKFDHSPEVRHFIETEIDIADKNNVAETKALIGQFLKELLGKSEIVEAPGMFSMAFNKK
jgi:adenylate cyclase class IV